MLLSWWIMTSELMPVVETGSMMEGWPVNLKKITLLPTPCSPVIKIYIFLLFYCPPLDEMHVPIYL